MAELNIGQQCDVKECRQLDFLPYKCDGCSLTFCGLHRTKDSHLCTELEQPQDTPIPYDGPKSFPCVIESCNKTELSPIVCDGCGRQFCLTHRISEDHACPSVKPREPERNATAKHVQHIIANKPAEPTKKKRPLNAKAAKTAAKIALMKLKGCSVGETSVPENDRVYFNVFYKDCDMVKSKGVFVSQEWTLGKAIDSCAKVIGLTNDNNSSSSQKLRLFSREGNILPVSDIVAAILSQELIHNGSSLVLEYVSSDTDSIDTQPYIR